MFNGKMKAVTFSYDDGITQDRKLVSILDRYGLKATFNINSGVLGTSSALYWNDYTISHVKPRACEVEKIYKGHEIAVHTLTHPSLKTLPDEEVIRQVEEDRVRLSELAGYDVVGMAYPGGTGCMDDRVVRLIRENTGVRYARTTTDTGNFDTQTDLLRFDPTVYHLCGWGKLYSLAEEFLAMKPETPKLFYIWGHAYEFDFRDDWNRFEDFCRFISGKDDIFYGTNKEVLLDTDN